MKKFKETLSLFEMSNLSTYKTGLDYKIWIMHRTKKEKHGPRVKVNINGEDIPISISNVPIKMVETETRIPKFRKLQDWIRLNKDLLLEYWYKEGDLTSDEVIPKLKKLP